MKKIIALFTALVLGTCVSACASGGGKSNATPATVQRPQAIQTVATPTLSAPSVAPAITASGCTPDVLRQSGARFEWAYTNFSTLYRAYVDGSRTSKFPTSDLDHFRLQIIDVDGNNIPTCIVNFSRAVSDDMKVAYHYFESNNTVSGRQAAVALFNYHDDDIKQGIADLKNGVIPAKRPVSQ